MKHKFKKKLMIYFIICIFVMYYVNTIEFIDDINFQMHQTIQIPECLLAPFHPIF